MNNIKADASNIGSRNPLDSSANNQCLFIFDYAEKADELQSILLAELKENKKVIRLFRCYGCEKHYALKKMSSCLIICRKCFLRSREKGKIAQNNFVEKAVNNLRIFFRRCI